MYFVLKKTSLCDTKKLIQVSSDKSNFNTKDIYYLYQTETIVKQQSTIDILNSSTFKFCLWFGIINQFAL